MAKTSKQFIQDLPKIYGTYTGGFLLFIILMGIAEKMGLSGRNIGLAFVGFTILIYALIGWISRTTDVDEYYLAGKKVPTVFNGMERQLTGCQVLLSLQWQAVSTLVDIPTWHS